MWSFLHEVQFFETTSFIDFPKELHAMQWKIHCNSIVGLAALLKPTFVFLIVGYEAKFYGMNKGFIATNFSRMYDAEKTVLVLLSSWMHRNRYKRWKGACTDL